MLHGTSSKGKNQVLQNDFENALEAYEEQGKYKYIDAKRKYIAAKNLNFDDALAQSKRYPIAGKLEVAYVNFIKDGDIFVKALGYPFALENYQEALRIKPGNVTLKQKIKRCQELIRGAR